MRPDRTPPWPPAPGSRLAPVQAGRDRRWGWLLLAPAAALLLVAGPALARVGGGQSFGGGGGGGDWGGGGSGGGDAELAGLVIRLLLWLLIEHPALGIPVTIVVVVAYAYHQRQKRRTTFRSGVVPPAAGRPASRPAGDPLASGVAAIRRQDPSFSVPLLLDFVQLLYSRVLEGLGRGERGPVDPYLGPGLWESLGARLGLGRPGVTGLGEVVVGALRLLQAGVQGPRARVLLELEADYSLRRGQASERRYTRERWTMSKAAAAPSPGPERITRLGCPVCGSSNALTPQGSCGYCGNAVAGGRVLWMLERVEVLDSRPVDLSGLGSEHAPETGTELPTVYAPDLRAQLARLQAGHAGFDQTRFLQRVKGSFLALQQAWSTLTWERARPYETDALFNTHRFWIERYKRAGRRNVCEQVKVLQIELVKVERDAFYEAITVRLFASMLDYTVDADGRVLSGSRTAPRRFSEYWTFLRSADFTTETSHAVDACPSCGAGLQVNAAGACGYCGSVVTNGQFDWVVSRIDQDEVYQG